MRKTVALLATLGMAGVLALTACSNTPVAGLPELPEVNQTADPIGNSGRVFGENGDIYDGDTYNYAFEDETLMHYWPELPPMPNYNSVIGTITSIYTTITPTPEGHDPTYFPPVIMHEIWVEDAEGGQVVFITNHNTAMLLSDTLEEGKSIIGYFDNFAPTMMIYPPHHLARALITTPENGTVMVDRFDANFLNSAGDLVINIAENTEIVFQDGTPFEGELDELVNRLLAIEYQIVGMSWPGITTPSRIVILFEIAVHPIHHFTEEELAGLELGFTPPFNVLYEYDGATGDVGFGFGGPLQLTPEDLDIMWNNLINPETVQIIVDGEVIEAATPFVNRDAGLVMLPVAAIAEAMGFNVVGEGADIVIGAGITFTVGVDSYFIGRMAAMQLGAVPELVDGVLFVPENFFYHILNGVAYIEDGNVIVLSENTMTFEDAD